MASFLARPKRVRMAPMGVRRHVNVPHFGAFSSSGVDIGAVSESGSGFRCSVDRCPARVDAGSSTSWRAGLGSRVKGPWCWSNVLWTVPRHGMRPTEGSRESTVCWGVSVPSPVAEGVGARVKGGPTNVDRTGCQGWPLGSDVVAALLIID